MEQNEIKEISEDKTVSVKNTSETTSSPDSNAGSVLTPQVGEEECPTCRSEEEPISNEIPSVSFIYALGRVEVQFPTLAVEKEFAQATGRSDTVSLTDRQALHEVLSERQNIYLARKLCWVLTIEGIETYIIQPHYQADLDILVESIRPAPRPTDVDVIIGMRGPIAPPNMCNGLMLPIVVFDQIYSFDIDSIIKSIPRPEKITAKQFGPVAEELFMRIMQIADNAGQTDEHRAMNYLAVRYPAIYANVVDAYSKNNSLTSVSVRTSRLTGNRNIVDVIFAYTHRQTDVREKFFVRVDVTEEFPFLVSKISPYYVYDQNP